MDVEPLFEETFAYFYISENVKRFFIVIIHLTLVISSGHSHPHPLCRIVTTLPQTKTK